MQSFYRPSQTLHSYWVFCIDYPVSNIFPYQDGKWMMFFPIQEMDKRWAEACHLYNSGKLTGINSMKASTAKQNPLPERLHGPDEGIIIFYCGPSKHRQNVMAYGRNLLNKMKYPRSKLYFKSDLPHLVNNSNEYKHMYFIDTKEHYSRMKSKKMNKRQQPAKRNDSTSSESSNNSPISADFPSSIKALPDYISTSTDYNSASPNYFSYSPDYNSPLPNYFRYSPDYYINNYTHYVQPFSQYGYNTAPIYYYPTNYFYSY